MISQKQEYKEKINNGIVLFGKAKFVIKIFPQPSNGRTGQILHIQDRQAKHISGLFSVGAGLLSGDVRREGTKYPFLLQVKDEHLIYTDELIEALQAGDYLASFNKLDSNVS